MNNGIIKIYALAVCFSSLLCGAITTGFFLYNVVKIIAPEATMDPYTTRFYSSNEAFRSSPPYSALRDVPVPFALGPDGALAPPLPTTNDKSEKPKLSDEEIEKLRLQQLDSAVSSHRGTAQQSMILQTIIMLICSVLYITHWKLNKKY